jgi:hypothetical protein
LTSSVSSQLSHVSHGVFPPAQFVLVPARLTYSRTRVPSLSTSIVVVPPEGLLVVDESGHVGDGEGLGAADLVVVDQDVAVAALAHEARRPVGIRRRRLAGLEQGLAGPREDRVREACGQREQARGVVLERPVAGGVAAGGRPWPLRRSSSGLSWASAVSAPNRLSRLPLIAMPRPAAERVSTDRRDKPAPRRFRVDTR